ncbi:MAG TPA: hypothetical protein VFS40_04470 [Gemmatimonadales bacterium]|nr:hypothetical protein [Gemmatimonadales bacterium]
MTWLAACGGDTSSTGPGYDGGGAPNPFVQPTGAAFRLPAGVTVQGPMTGILAFGSAQGPCGSAESVGHALDLVRVCVTLHNATAADTVVVFPAGLILMARDTATQNGTQVVPVSVRVPAGRDTSFVYSLFCVNEHRSASSDTDTFTFGPVSDHAGLREIIALVAGKSIDDSEAAYTIQDAVWKVSDWGGLTDESRAALRALP